MPRYIDAEHLKKRATDTTGDCWDNYGQGTADFLEYIDKEPTVDAAEVVRCKDCKYREVQVDGVFRYEMCGIRSEIINLEGFCHMGKRREDG